MLHDNDMLVPSDFARIAMEVTGSGYVVMNLMRFVFYQRMAHTQKVIANKKGFMGDVCRNRSQTLQVWPWGGIPLVHLWHATQTGKHDANYHTAQHYGEQAQIDPQECIRRLFEVAGGRMNGPAGLAPASLCRDRLCAITDHFLATDGEL